MAVCVAADGLGPWEKEEMEATLNLAVHDGRPIISVLLSGALSKPELPIFLANHTWADLRRGLDAEGIDRLEWGITGKKPSEGTAVPVDVPGDDEIPTLSDSRFLDEIFELLYTYPTLILLAQEDREQHAGLEALRERAQFRFGAEQILYLVSLCNPEADETEFFRALAKRACMDPPVKNAVEFEDYLDDRLTGSSAGCY